MLSLPTRESRSRKGRPKFGHRNPEQVKAKMSSRHGERIVFHKRRDNLCS